MGNRHSKSNFREVEHTGDISLEIWAEDLLSLFITSADGMYYQLGVKKQEKSQAIIKEIDISEEDLDSLLVSFMNELLFYVEQGIFFQDFNIQIKGNSLSGLLKGKMIHSIQREIKAVTYHNLEIKIVEGKYLAQLVFDI